MDLRRHQLALLAAFAASLSSVSYAQAPAETAPSAASAPAAPAEVDPAGGIKNPKAAAAEAPLEPELESVRKALQALTPEQRKRFLGNLQKWTELTPAERKALRARDEVRRKHIAEEIRTSLEQSGLTFTPQLRNQFTKRYMEERRKLEERLRKEMDEKRKPALESIVADLRTEFAAKAATSGTSNVPAPTSAPVAATPVPATPASNIPGLP